MLGGQLAPSPSVIVIIFLIACGSRLEGGGGGVTQLAGALDVVKFLALPHEGLLKVALIYWNGSGDNGTIANLGRRRQKFPLSGKRASCDCVALTPYN